MKLFRYGPDGQEKPGVELDSGKRVSVSSLIQDYNESFFQNGGLEKLRDVDLTNLPEVNEKERFGPPVSRPSKIICVGLNYANHAREAGMDIPKEPILFFKASTSLCGPYDTVIIPKNSLKTDWEVELNIVIGKKAQYVSIEDAYDYIAGYTLANDISEREFQLEKGGQWVKGKSCDTFSPVGPYLVTKDEIPNPNNLKLWLKVNGEMRQNSNTQEFIFNVEQVVSYISQFMTLLPGDMIFTGTPPGVGMGMKPPVFVKDGDVMELGIDGLGKSCQTAKNYN